LFIKKQSLKNKLKKLLKTQTVIVWGAGSLVRSVLPKSQKNLLGFVDNNLELQGKIIDKYRVYSINDLKNVQPDCILAISQNYYKFGKIVQNQLKDNGLDIKVLEFTL
jgi:hypothetical protein